MHRSSSSYSYLLLLVPGFNVLWREITPAPAFGRARPRRLPPSRSRFKSGTPPAGCKEEAAKLRWPDHLIGQLRLPEDHVATQTPLSSIHGSPGLGATLGCREMMRSAACGPHPLVGKGCVPVRHHITPARRDAHENSSRPPDGLTSGRSTSAVASDHSEKKTVPPRSAKLRAVG